MIETRVHAGLREPADLPATATTSRTPPRSWPPRPCRTARPTTARRSGNSRPSTWTPEEIHQLGLSEVAKIHAQMLEVMKETGLQGRLPGLPAPSCAPTRSSM